MAAGAISGDSLESSLEKRFQNVSNTMDSIQGLSTWCIDNKKYHSLIVRHWIKCMKKSDSSHRLNLFYVANDVIQNCKRQNAIVYRTAFAEVLRDACMLVNVDGDRKVIKSVGRILSIWEERGVYSGSLITELKSSLIKSESPPETPVEQKTPVESKADLRSTIVAEFVPQALVDKLSRYKKSLEEVDLREKQLAAMRIDICNAENLRKLKDKAGGKKFSKDFEEGSAQLQEFIKLLNGHCKTGPPLMQILSNADIFYETQYKEVKIVANAYQAFANRVSHLKRKLDALKATLPDLDDSPIPSPSADAPSPTGSESPFHGMELGHASLDAFDMDDDTEPPAPSPLSSPGGSPKLTPTLDNDDNRMVEDMDLSDEEADGGIIEQQIECSPKPEASAPFPTRTEPSVAAAAAERPLAQFTAPVSDAAAAVDGIDLAKIGSILNSLSSVMKSADPVVESPPVAVPSESSVKSGPAASVAPQDASSLVSLLSKVDVCPVDLLSALSKVQKPGGFEGIDPLLPDPAANASVDSCVPDQAPPAPASTSAPRAPPQGLPLSSVPSDSQAPAQTFNPASALIQALHQDMDLSAEHEPSYGSQSLESKIHNFLQGNSAFSAFDLRFSGQPGGNLSPVTAADTQGGTPVRDEGGGTPTQDEMMDKAGAGPAAPAAYQKPSNPLQQSYAQPAVAENGQLYGQRSYANHDVSEQGAAAAAARYPPVSAQTGRPGEMAPGGDGSAQTVAPIQMVNDRGWFNSSYSEGGSQPLGGFNAPALRGAPEKETAGLYPYQTQQPNNMASQQGPTVASGFFTKGLPPVPVIPPPPQGFENPLPGTSGAVVPQEPQLHPGAEDVMGDRAGSVISGMVVHDHQHKSVFRPDDSVYDRPPRPEDQRYQDAPERYHNEPHHHSDHFFQDDPYLHPDEPYHRQPGPGGAPPPFPRVRGHLTPPLSPSEDPYFSHDYQRHGPPPPPRFAPRRPPPHLEMRHPGLRPPPRPPHPPPHHFPRGPPRPPFPPFRGPDPRLRGKRPGLMGRGTPGPMFAPKRPFLPPRY